MTDSNTANNSLAIVFPGQGSQSPGMSTALAEQFAVVRDTYAEASDALGYDLWQLVAEGTVEELNRTDRTQPAMLVAGVSTWRAWKEAGGAVPAMMAGHSLGEYTALVCAGALPLSQAAPLVATRGRLMQAAVPAGTGAMAAILGLDDETVIETCNSAAGEQVVSAVNFNSPGQVVIAGDKDAVERAIDIAREHKARKAVLLPVSVPSHCSLMRPAADRFRAELETVTFASPEIPVIQNVDVVSHADTAAIVDALARQLYNPVRWVETIFKFASSGINTVVEAGPGKVLTGLNKRIDKSVQAVPVVDPDTLVKALDAVNTSI